ncbi:MAG TPA: NUDIX hydrolase [Phnomibacter sp.]|mgnify:CR=1 FL=1|nr:NUDIX hydrolase [Phnomibacter sp.]
MQERTGKRRCCFMRLRPAFLSGFSAFLYFWLVGFLMGKTLSMAKHQPWKHISSRYIHQEKWFKLRADKVLKGNGQPMEPYYVTEYSHWVNVLPITTDGMAVLVRQYRYALGVWSIEVPGGIMDPHETDPAEAARRELLEETGYTAQHLQQVAVLATNPATQNNNLYAYLATGCTLTHALNLDENEEIEVLLVAVDELVYMLRHNQIVQSLHTASIFYALQALGKV